MRPAASGAIVAMDSAICDVNRPTNSGGLIHAAGNLACHDQTTRQSQANRRFAPAFEGDKI
jgi:hypothetical protein